MQTIPMQIDIASKHIELNAPLRTFVQEKIGALAKYFKTSEEPDVYVEIAKPSQHHRSGDIFSAVANVTIGGTLLRATAENSDLHIAITTVRDELQTQIKKFKDKELARRKAI